MERVIIFGAGGTGKRVYKAVKEDCEVVGFLDSDSSFWGKELFPGVKVLGNADCLDHMEGQYDRIIIAVILSSTFLYDELLEKGISPAVIDRSYITVPVMARVNFLRDYASMCYDAPGFDVAEGGVFQGEFAKEIARYFPGRKLYLFDTFEGFDLRDVSVEKEKHYSPYDVGRYNTTSEELVLSKLPNPDDAVIRKGYFPETAAGLEDRRFLFVNLDFDLYQPLLEGLRFFYPRMRERGVLLMHDYFGDVYMGAHEAVRTYEEECGITLVKMPIGDGCSIAIYKV